MNSFVNILNKRINYKIVSKNAECNTYRRNFHEHIFYLRKIHPFKNNCAERNFCFQFEQFNQLINLFKNTKKNIYIFSRSLS